MAWESGLPFWYVAELTWQHREMAKRAARCKSALLLSVGYCRQPELRVEMQSGEELDILCIIEK